MKKKLKALGWVVLKSRLAWVRWAGDEGDRREVGEPPAFPCLARRSVNRYDEYEAVYLVAADLQVLVAALEGAIDA
jgi:hypothetical protein